MYNFRIHRRIYIYRCIIFDFVERHDAIFIVGALDEAIVLRGLRYHPIDIENSVMRSHRKISEWLVVIFL